MDHAKQKRNARKSTVRRRYVHLFCKALTMLQFRNHRFLPKTTLLVPCGCCGYRNLALPCLVNSWNFSRRLLSACWPHFSCRGICLPAPLQRIHSFSFGSVDALDGCLPLIYCILLDFTVVARDSGSACPQTYAFPWCRALLFPRVLMSECSLYVR